MQNYYDCGGGGCFAGECKIKTLIGLKRIDTIRKGDIVMNDTIGKQSKVVAIIKILCEKPIKMIRIGELLITPKHPICINNKWIKPRDIDTSTN